MPTLWSISHLVAQCNTNYYLLFCFQFKIHFSFSYDTVDEALDWPQLRTIAVIAEGVPERRT